jgi:hypothetical protein
MFATPRLASGVDAHREYRVKYVAEGAVYLEGGRNVGLAKGMKLSVKRTAQGPAEAGKDQPVGPQVMAQIRVVSVAQISSVCEVLEQKEEIRVGDVASLNPEEFEALVQQEALSPTRKYPQVVTFTEGDPLDEEARESVPRPSLPEINRARGRIGLEYGGLSASSPASTFTNQFGLVLQTDITRIGGTYWNLAGHWRGRFDSRSGVAGPQTLDDLINRTYQLAMTYANPNSHWVAGFGRFYLPWATSLDTIDGGYFGRRVSHTVTLGVFGGSTPDPASWNYNPNRRIAGTFVNFEGGSFDATRYTATFGVGASSIGSWRPDRPFIFVETGLFYKRYLSIYESLQADRPKIQVANGAGNTTTTFTNTAGTSRSFVTVNLQPVSRFSININHNYFRDYPTFDLNLISTGLIDKLLFQGLSVGSQLNISKNLTFYNSFGRSSQSGEAHNAWNQMYGLTLSQIWRTRIRADVRYSKFNSAYASGHYEALFLSRSVRDNLALQVMAGQQNLVSPYTRQTSYRSLGTMLDWTPRSHLFMSLNFNLQRGIIQSYSQWFVSFGYRFDSRGVGKTEALRK